MYAAVDSRLVRDSASSVHDFGILRSNTLLSYQSQGYYYYYSAIFIFSSHSYTNWKMSGLIPIDVLVAKLYDIPINFFSREKIPFK